MPTFNATREKTSTWANGRNTFGILCDRHKIASNPKLREQTLQSIQMRRAKNTLKPVEDLPCSRTRESRVGCEVLLLENVTTSTTTTGTTTTSNVSTSKARSSSRSNTRGSTTGTRLVVVVAVVLALWQ